MLMSVPIRLTLYIRLVCYPRRRVFTYLGCTGGVVRTWACNMYQRVVGDSTSARWVVLRVVGTMCDVREASHVASAMYLHVRLGKGVRSDANVRSYWRPS